MNSQPSISVFSSGEQRLNGLGMMMLQYLEQNFADFEYKIKEGLRLRGCVAVEVDKGIATSIYFRGEKIEIANGVSNHPDLYLKSSYLLLANVLSGKANPYLELLRGKIKLKAWPKRPFQSYKILRFLKVPSELLQEKPSSRQKRHIILMVCVIPGIVVLLLLVYLLLSLVQPDNLVKKLDTSAWKN